MDKEALIIWKGKEINFEKPENPLSDRQVKTIVAIILFTISFISISVLIIVRIFN